MSVITTYARLDEAAIKSLRDDTGWLESLYRGQVPSSQVIDVDKACDGIVWLLSRSVSPAGRDLVSLLCGGGGISEPQLQAPYGPACSLSPAIVAEVGAWLEAVKAEELAVVYDPKALAKGGVYPQIWMQEGRAALDGYLVPHFKRLQQFFQEARVSRQAVLVFVT